MRWWRNNPIIRVFICPFIVFSREGSNYLPNWTNNPTTFYLLMMSCFWRHLLNKKVFYVFRYIYVFNFVLFTFIWKVVFLQHLFTKCIVSSIEIDSSGCSWNISSRCLKLEKSLLHLKRFHSTTLENWVILG